MGYLPDRKTRTIFVTGSTLHKNGKTRAVILETMPEYAILRLDGDKERFSIAWEAVYEMAVKRDVDCLREEEKATRKRKKPKNPK
jgi:hypothetical protein